MNFAHREKQAKPGMHHVEFAPWHFSKGTVTKKGPKGLEPLRRLRFEKRSLGKGANKLHAGLKPPTTLRSRLSIVMQRGPVQSASALIGLGVRVVAELLSFSVLFHLSG